jgi:hypothetical protein
MSQLEFISQTASTSVVVTFWLGIVVGSIVIVVVSCYCGLRRVVVVLWSSWSVGRGDE